MRVAVVGSRGLKVEHLENYLPEGVTEIVSGGARGVDTCAREYALSHGLKLTEFLPEYDKYGRSAETKHHHHRKRGSGAGLLGWRFPRNEICNQAMQKPEYSGESVCPFPFRLTSLHRQSNIQPYCPEPVEYPQAPFFCSQRKKGFLTEEQSI